MKNLKKTLFLILLGAFIGLKLTAPPRGPRDEFDFITKVFDFKNAEEIDFKYLQMRPEPIVLSIKTPREAKLVLKAEKTKEWNEAVSEIQTKMRETESFALDLEKKAQEKSEKYKKELAAIHNKIAKSLTGDNGGKYQTLSKSLKEKEINLANQESQLSENNKKTNKIFMKLFSGEKRTVEEKKGLKEEIDKINKEGEKIIKNMNEIKKEIKDIKDQRFEILNLPENKSHLIILQEYIETKKNLDEEISKYRQEARNKIFSMHKETEKMFDKLFEIYKTNQSSKKNE